MTDRLEYHLALALGVAVAFWLLPACTGGETYEGRKLSVDYREAQIEPGAWIQIDSVRFEHIGRRDEARTVRYPLPSRNVFVDSARGRAFTRDYNPKGIPVYIANHLDRVNEHIPDSVEYVVPNATLMSYAGVLTLIKKDSSAITIRTSKGYDADVKVEK